MLAWVRALSKDEAVSPVIGMILVLGISVTAIAAILYWGLPAIDEMKANVEFKSVQTQFTELDGTIKELVAGTTEKTAKRWEPTLNRGSIVVNNNTQGWVYAIDLTPASGAATDLVWDGFVDAGAPDNVFYVYNNGATMPLGGQMRGYNVTGSATATSLFVNIVSGTPGTQMASPTVITNWASGHQWQAFYVYDTSGNPVKLQQGTFQFQFFDSTGKKVAEAFFMNTGSIDYKLQAGLGEKTVSENNGAVMTGASSPAAVVNTPSIPPPATTNGISRFFGRAVVLNGDAGYAGDNRFSALISLYSTAVLASYDCAQTDFSDCVAHAKLTNFDATSAGSYRTTWYSYLTGPSYHFTKQVGSGLGNMPNARPPTDYLVDSPAAGHEGYTLLESTVLLSS